MTVHFVDFDSRCRQIVVDYLSQYDVKNAQPLSVISSGLSNYNDGREVREGF